MGAWIGWATHSRPAGKDLLLQQEQQPEAPLDVLRHQLGGQRPVQRLGKLTPHPTEEPLGVPKQPVPRLRTDKGREQA